MVDLDYEWDMAGGNNIFSEQVLQVLTIVIKSRGEVSYLLEIISLFFFFLHVLEKKRELLKKRKKELGRDYI